MYNIYLNDKFQRLNMCFSMKTCDVHQLISKSQCCRYSWFVDISKYVNNVLLRAPKHLSSIGATLYGQLSTPPLYTPRASRTTLDSSSRKGTASG